jgi:hypothetical protein
MEMEGLFVETVQYKRFIWYGHLQWMGESKWLKKICNWMQEERRTEEKVEGQCQRIHGM